MQNNREFCDSIGMSRFIGEQVNRYISYDVRGKVIKAAIKDDNGNWHDNTAIERQKQEVEMLKMELERQRRLAIIAEHSAKTSANN